MKKINSKVRRKKRNRKQLKRVNPNKLRITVYKSLNNISVQIIDDNVSKTLVSASSIKENKKDKKKADLSLHVAGILVKKALEKKITKVYFDRGSYKYHGRIKAFAEALRKGGLNF